MLGSRKRKKAAMRSLRISESKAMIEAEIVG